MVFKGNYLSHRSPSQTFFFFFFFSIKFEIRLIVIEISRVFNKKQFEIMQMYIDYEKRRENIKFLGNIYRLQN